MWWAGLAAAATVGSAVDGWAVTVPDGWQSADQGDGTWVVGSPVETGLVVLSWAPGATFADLQAQAASPLRDGGLVLATVAGPTERSYGAARGVAADYQGAAADGASVAAHAVAIAAPTGGLVVTGLAPAAALPPLSARVDAIAASAVFGPPSRGAVHTLRGALCAPTPGGSRSEAQRMTFDGAGTVTTSSPFAEAPSSGAPPATYAVSGEAVVVRWPGGAERRCTVAARTADGLVTALRCADRLWTAASC
jgi:hypothetical protein